MKKRLSFSEYVSGITGGSRVILGQAITLAESTLPADEQLSAELLDALLPHTGNSIRIGITGVPGVGKSTFIESFGTLLTSEGKKLAVLTIDPSSQVTHGSILGDKTRMEALSKNPLAFIRPTASGSVLGGVAHRTREAILLCEAAGFDTILVETVGTGQSETAVKGMVDFFLLLMLAGAGDELQGIKKGIMEMADAVVITKADGGNTGRARQAAADYQHALHLFQPPASGWTPRVLTCSALENTGLRDIFHMLQEFREQLGASGLWEHSRRQQEIVWMEENFRQQIQQAIFQSPRLQQTAAHLKEQVIRREISAVRAAMQLFDAFRSQSQV